MSEQDLGDPQPALRRLVHELRQSLGTILMLAGAAQVHDDVPPELARVLGLIEAEVEEAAAICRALLQSDQ